MKGIRSGSTSRGLILARWTANFAGPKTRKKLNSPAWKIYSPADEILLLTYFHGVIQEDRISTFLNCLVGKFQKIACGAILFQHLEFSTLSCFCCISDHLLNFSHCFSACVNPKILVVPQVLKWLLYHHKFPKIPLNIELATLDFFMKNRPFLANWKSQIRNFLPSAQTMVAPPWSQKRVFNNSDPISGRLSVKPNKK